MASRDAILQHFSELHTLTSEELLTLRYTKYRAIGRYYEEQHAILSGYDA